jgi:hypothetical protein
VLVSVQRACVSVYEPKDRVCERAWSVWECVGRVEACVGECGPCVSECVGCVRV